ncbi:MAG: hypothetical protein QOJ46_1574 [bacterium]
MSRPVRFAFKTLYGPWLVAPVIALETANFLQRGMPWRGEGMWTVEWFAIAMFLIGPLCAGVGAVDASRLTRPGNIHLVLSSRARVGRSCALRRGASAPSSPSTCSPSSLRSSWAA